MKATKPAPDFRKISAFEWNEQRSNVALAEGQTQRAVAAKFNITDRTIRNWLQDSDFSAEVDRLSQMVELASKAARMRVAMRVARAKGAESASPKTGKDLLDWLKFAKSETDTSVL